MLKLALRNVFRHRTRSALTLIAISFGVIGLILSGGFVADVFVQLAEATIHSQLGHVQIAKPGFFTHGTRSPYDYRIENPGPLRRELEKLNGVDDVMLRLNFSGLISNGKADLAIFGEGIEPDKEARLGSFLKIIEGRQLKSSDTYGIILGEGVAQALKLRAKDPVTLLLNTKEGALNTIELEVVGIARSFSKDYDARVVRITLPAAQDLLASAAINSYVISLRDTQKTEPTLLHLQKILDKNSYEVKSWQHLSDFYSSTVALYERQFGVLKIIILVMVLLSVVNSVSMTVMERIGEFGTLMALGNKRRTLFQLVVVENTLLGMFGGLLGVVLGVALALLISAMGITMPPPPNSNSGYTAIIRVVPEIIVTAFFVGFLATVLASLLPARRASRLPVAEALRQN
mgnify:CR=1 FL=1